MGRRRKHGVVTKLSREPLFLLVSIRATPLHSADPYVVARKLP